MEPSQAPELARRLSLWQVVLYGLGTTVGAGIYVLVGEVAGLAGARAPWAFAFAAALASLTALSFAELVSRLPSSAGEAAFVRTGFGKVWLSTAVGLSVVAAGVVSAAAIANGFAGYLSFLVSVPDTLAMVLLVIALTILAGWGVAESVNVAALFTALEIGGLLWVIAVGAPALAEFPARVAEFAPPLSLSEWSGVGGAALLAFYAFLGFEDMVNISEEVAQPRRNVPLAILATLVITSVLYVAISLIAVLNLPIETLSASDAPLALLFERATGRAPTAISAIGVVAVVNGALIQIIMAARVLYGLARRGEIPRVLGRVSPRTRTPVLATGLAGITVLVLALAFPLAKLAALTSFLTLLVFTLVNAALWRIHARAEGPPAPYPVHRFVPIAGTLVTGAFLASRLIAALH